MYYLILESYQNITSKKFVKCGFYVTSTFKKKWGLSIFPLNLQTVFNPKTKSNFQPKFMLLFAKVKGKLNWRKLFWWPNIKGPKFFIPGRKIYNIQISYYKRHWVHLKQTLSQLQNILT